MSTPKQVWVTDKRDPKKPAFLYPAHLVKLSKNLEETSPPETGRIEEPAQKTTTKKVGK